MELKVTVLLKFYSRKLGQPGDEWLKRLSERSGEGRDDDDDDEDDTVRGEEW